MLNPADGWYELGAPCVEEAKLKLHSGKTLRIVAKNLSDTTTTVQKVTFNGQQIDDWRISHAELMQGGNLVFEY